MSEDHDIDLPDPLDIRHGPSAGTVKALMRKLEEARVEIERLKAGQHSPAPDLTGLAKRLRERADRLSRAFNPGDLPKLFREAAVAIERLGGAARPAVDREALGRVVYWASWTALEKNAVVPDSWKDIGDSRREYYRLVADAIVAALGQPCPKPAEVAGIDGNLPIEAIVDVRRGDKWSWHAFGRFHDAQMFAAKAEADEDIVRVNIMNGTWTYHPATQPDATEARP